MEFVDDLLDSAEKEPEFDEHLMAFDNFNPFGGRLLRRTVHGLDVTPFAAR